MRVKFWKSILISFLLSSYMISCCVADDDEGDDELSEEDRPRSCAKYVGDFVSTQLKAVLECLSGQSTFKVNSIFEYVSRSSCLLKCVLMHGGIVGTNGRLDEIAAAFYFEENFDQPVKDITLPIAQACFALADKFDPKEYWCKSYLEFTECAFRAILAGLIPYGGSCVTNPVLGILFSVLKYLAPDSPKVDEDMEELRRSVAKGNQIKCLDKNCTRLYEYKKVNGTQSVVMYNKDMEVLSVDNRKSKPKPKKEDLANAPASDNNNNNYNYNYNDNYSYRNYNNFSNYNYNRFNSNNGNNKNGYKYGYN